MKINKYQWGGYSPILTELAQKSSADVKRDAEKAITLIGWPGWDTFVRYKKAFKLPDDYDYRRNAARVSAIGDVGGTITGLVFPPLGIVTKGAATVASNLLEDLALEREAELSNKRRKTADDFNLNNSPKNNNKIVKDLEPAGPISYSTTPFNRYQSLKSPITGNPIVVKTDNTLWTWYRGRNPWKYINGGTRYRKGEKGWEIQKFDGGGGYMDYSDPSDIDYWTNYVIELEKVLPNVPKKNIFGITRKNQNGGLLMRNGGKIIEVPFASFN